MLGSHPDEMLGQAAPELTLSSLGGASVSLNDFSGQVVLVNIWATWCGPCRIELPHIQDLHERYGNDGLAVLAINAGESEDQIRRYLSQEGLTFRVLLDPESQSLRTFSTSGIPTVVLIDREGIVRYGQVGYSPGSDQELEREVQALLAEN
jgi:thiol-disulfide isomerase/thioredoxin